MILHSDMSPNSEIICLETAPPSKTQPEATFNRRAFLSRHKVLFSASCSFLVIICLLLAFNGQAFIEPGKSHAANDSDNHEEVCQRPNLRLEWRSLDKVQQHDYIQAVKCLKTIVSHLQLNQTLYDDFPWVHKKFGEYSHDAAPFFAWHRYFIHTYERILQSHCDYQGSLPYWDWTLDWENITLSPIWDTETGFGGTGNASTGNPIFKAYCVTEGPFANLEIPYFEDIYQPHCLLRGFDANLEDFRTELRPQALMKLLLSLDYETFNLGLENGPHIAIPKSINGDFSLHTAPFGESSPR